MDCSEAGRRRTLLVAAASMTLVGPRPASCQSPVVTSLPAVDSIFSDMVDLRRPGYAVGVVRGGRLWYARGFGAADLDHGVPITPSSVFNVASLSKQFTAASLAILIRRGLVSLEDEVRAYLPEFPERFGRVELQHLVYMTSGLPEYYTLERPGGMSWQYDHFTVEDALATMFAQPTLEFAPGSAWAYSNTNYQLIAEIVARVSGRSFADFVQREIFEPLGMSSSHVNDDLGRIVPHRVTGYNRIDAGGYRRELRRSPHYGGSGVFTTLEDLARWDRSLREHTLGGPRLTEILLQTRRFDHEKANDAFGLVWGEFQGRRTLWYEGGDLGFSAYMAHLPDDDLTVFVLSNLGDGRAADRARGVLAVLLRRH